MPYPPRKDVPPIPLHGRYGFLDGWHVVDAPLLHGDVDGAVQLGRAEQGCAQAVPRPDRAAATTTKTTTTTCDKKRACQHTDHRYRTALQLGLRLDLSEL